MQTQTFVGFKIFLDDKSKVSKFFEMDFKSNSQDLDNHVI